MFELVGLISEIEPIAAGASIRERTRLNRFYGKARWRKLTKRDRAVVVCTHNDGYAASLETCKIYRTVAGPEQSGLIRVIDESGEDYLYPAGWFEPIEIGPRLQSVLKLAS